MSTAMKKVSEIQKEYKDITDAECEAFILKYRDDDRSAVRKLSESARKRLEALDAEKKRMYEMFSFERQYEQYEYICGIDEVGRGPLAGPVAAGAVILPKDCALLYLNDSKQLSEKKREELYDQIMVDALATGIGFVSPERIDEIGISPAVFEAMREAIGQLQIKPSLLLVDAVKIPEVDIPQVSIIKGDAKSASIAAASIIAKVTRDRLMVQYDSIMPEYHFASNKGYGSKVHINAIKEYGPSAIHRRSFIGHFV